MTSWTGIENVELVVDKFGEEYDDELETEQESDSDGDPPSKRNFYKYDLDQMSKIVNLYFERGWAFKTVQEKYRRLTAVNEIHR